MAQNLRLNDRSGRQIVQVNLAKEGSRSENNYSYTWNGNKPLAVGDTVEVMTMGGLLGPYKVKVTKLGTDYTGPLSAILRKIEEEN